MNKAILFGNVGKDPVIRLTSGSKKTASFSLATSRHGKDSDGNKTTITQWHNIVLWEKLAELAEQYVKKGSSLIIEGEIQYRTYEDKDGNTKYITEIVGRELHFAGGKKEEKAETKAPEPQINNGDETDLPF